MNTFLIDILGSLFPWKGWYYKRMNDKNVMISIKHFKIFADTAST